MTGAGKSTLISWWAYNDILSREGAVCVIDPKGDLVDTIMRYIPDDRLDDVTVRAGHPQRVAPVQFGQPKYIYAIFAVNTVVVLLVVFQGVVTGVWRHLPVFRHIAYAFHGAVCGTIHLFAGKLFGPIVPCNAMYGRNRAGKNTAMPNCGKGRQVIDHRILTAETLSQQPLKPSFPIAVIIPV